MDTLGSFDYNQENAISNIQAAIKNHLSCDDILSEYITVLLRNNKSREEIINDVSEFIQNPEQVNSFIKWLWEFIPSFFNNSSSNSSAAKKSGLPIKPPSRLFLNAVKQATEDTKNLRTSVTSMDGVESSLDDESSENYQNRENNRENNRERRDNNRNKSFNKGDKNRHNNRDNNNNNRRDNNKGGRDNKGANVNFTITMDGLGDYMKDNKQNNRHNDSPNSKKRNRDEDDEESYSRNSKSIAVNTESIEDEPAIKKTKKKERCQFWPNCKNAESCEYHHPTTQCQLFPKCTYGNSCLFIHPSIPCRFGTSCTNPECQYNHPQRMMPTHMPVLEVPCRHGFACPNKLKSCTFAHPPVACKFADKCTNQFCMFGHGKPCMYGVTCVTPGCKFTHHLTEQPFPPCRFGKDCTNANCKFLHTDRDVDTQSLSNTLPSTPPQNDDQMSISESSSTIDVPITSNSNGVTVGSEISM